MIGLAAYSTHLYPAHDDAAPPPGGKPRSDFKALIPDWNEFNATHDQYVKEWNDLTGLQ